jgi:two-component system, OmpR family, response regulator RegX3
MPRVLIVDDNRALVDALVVHLAADGFEVAVAQDAARAVTEFEAMDPDIVLLDLVLPRASGLDVCRAIRAQSDAPIIVISARKSELDKVLSLELGADDFVSKPFSHAELLARVHSVLRRGATHQPAVVPALDLGRVRLDHTSHTVVVDGEVVNLALREFAVLELLMNNQGRVISRDQLMDSLWGTDTRPDSKSLYVHIQRIRAKIEADPAHPHHLQTVRGVGYRFQA